MKIYYVTANWTIIGQKLYVVVYPKDGFLLGQTYPSYRVKIITDLQSTNITDENDNKQTFSTDIVNLIIGIGIIGVVGIIAIKKKIKHKIFIDLNHDLR